MAQRDIIEINRDLCNGCGLCTHACAEGALTLDKEGKAVLVNEIYCDGLGACLDVCPTGALKVIKRDSQEYDPVKTHEHVSKTRGDQSMHSQGGCPGSMAREFSRSEKAKEGQAPVGKIASELSQWPIQLHLISPHAPYFQNADLLIAADCTAFTLGSFHPMLLKTKRLVIACPKLDDTGGYVDKLTELITTNNLQSLTVVIMEVPCCSGLLQMVEAALKKSKTLLRPQKIVIGLEGDVVSIG